jgi:hypothetical protein
MFIMTYVLVRRSKKASLVPIPGSSVGAVADANNASGSEILRPSRLCNEALKLSRANDEVEQVSPSALPRLWVCSGVGHTDGNTWGR